MTEVAILRGKSEGFQREKQRIIDYTRPIHRKGEYNMHFLPVLAKMNIGCRKAAAPNKGAAAFFCSTEFFLLRHIAPLFKNHFFAVNASKKA